MFWWVIFFRFSQTTKKPGGLIFLQNMQRCHKFPPVYCQQCVFLAFIWGCFRQKKKLCKLFIDFPIFFSNFSFLDPWLCWLFFFSWLKGNLKDPTNVEMKSMTTIKTNNHSQRYSRSKSIWTMQCVCQPEYQQGSQPACLSDCLCLY